jgi:hypothetical protein
MKDDGVMRHRGADARQTKVQTEPPAHIGPSAGWDQPQPGAPSPADPRYASNTAIIAWHGMGQQLQFETIEAVARGLAKRVRAPERAEQTVTARLVELGDQKLWRTELELTDAAGGRHRVHVYEAYWAQYTQGRITLGETVRFLFAAGYQGIRYGFWPPFVLRRHLFNRWVNFRLSPLLTAVYLVLLATVSSLVFVNLVATTTLMIKLLTGPGNPASWPNYALLGDLTLDLAVLAVPYAVTGVVLLIAYQRQTSHARRAAASEPRLWVQVLIWILVAIAIVVTLGVGVLVAYHLFVHVYWNDPARAWPQALDDLLARWRLTPPINPPGLLALAAAIWLTVFIASSAVRWFLLEFVGDAAIYVSSHKLNRFFETRQHIRTRSTEIARAIYQFGGYTRHILMGHSLGSVVAYDTLNGLIVDDTLAAGRLRVAERTALLLTFGSILDKMAFLFRAQADVSDVREALVSASQPLISDPAARPRWINIFSRQDVLSGALDFYDVQNGEVEPAPGPLPPLPGPVDNLEDRHAWIPLLAHVQYWSNDLLLNTLADAAMDGGAVCGVAGVKSTI